MIDFAPSHRARQLLAWLLPLAACVTVFNAFATPAPPRVDDVSLQAAVRNERARPRPPQFTRAQFLATPVLLGAWLSPDGSQLATLRDDAGRRSVWRQPSAGGNAVRVLAQTEANELSWSRDGRWLFLQTSAGIHAVAAQGQSGSRLILGPGGKRQRDLLEVDRSAAAAVLVLDSPPVVSQQPRQWRVLRVDAQGKQAVVWQDSRPLVDLAVDGQGQAAFINRAEGDRQVVYRIQGRQLTPLLQCVRVERCGFLASQADGRALYMNTDVQAPFGRLARLDVDGTLTTLHSDPRGEADLQQVSLDPITGVPRFVAYRSTQAAVYGLDDHARAQLAALHTQLAQTDLRIEVAHAKNGRWLVHARDASHKGEQLFVIDPAGTRRARPLLTELGFQQARKPVPALPAAQMARKLPIRWTASDGMQLHGFVLLPPGVDAARAPLVANVHGGPFNLFRPEFSAQSQLLANRGYVVFEPNFRGSTGLGRQYLLAANGDFGNGRVQQDIVEGVRYLLGQGIGDAQRVGILGASFGGYSALQGVTFQPELFRVGVAAVPPADFGWVLRWYARGPDQMSRGVPMKDTMRLLSLDPASDAVAQRLREQSPIANAARLQRPVLLLAGADDERVPIRSVLHYAARLQSLDKSVSLFVDAEGRHQLVDPVTREAYLYLLEAMFQRHLGGPPPAAPSRALRAALDKNLRLDGAQLKPR